MVFIELNFLFTFEKEVKKDFCWEVGSMFVLDIFFLKK